MIAAKCCSSVGVRWHLVSLLGGVKTSETQKRQGCQFRLSNKRIQKDTKEIKRIHKTSKDKHKELPPNLFVSHKIMPWWRSDSDKRIFMANFGSKLALTFLTKR